MAYSTRARNRDLNVGLSVPESVFRSSGEEPNPSGQEKLPGDDKHPIAVRRDGTENRLEHWLYKVSTAQKRDAAGKAPVATDTNDVEDVGTANKNGDRLVRLSEVKSMIDQALVKFEKRRNSQVAQMAEMTVIDALEMCAVEGQQGSV